MENKHKQFKPYDRVLVRVVDKWICDLYSHYNNEKSYHAVISGTGLKDDNIIPYEGNESLLGTTEEPEEEIILKRREPILVSKRIYLLLNNYCYLREFDETLNSVFIIGGDSWDYAIRLSDFNPNDKEETKKHILCVKNGKVVRYKE